MEPAHFNNFFFQTFPFKFFSFVQGIGAYYVYDMRQNYLINKNQCHPQRTKLQQSILCSDQTSDRYGDPVVTRKSPYKILF